MTATDQSIRDMLMNVSSLLNDAIPIAVCYFVIDVSGAERYIYSSSDNSIISALKQTGINLATHVVATQSRLMFPALHFF